METIPVSGDTNAAVTADRTHLVHELRDLILESVNLKHRRTDDITENTALMTPPGEGPHDSLGLDSIDILEVVVAVEGRYGVKIKDGEDGKRVFRSLGSIADFVASQRK